MKARVNDLAKLPSDWGVVDRVELGFSASVREIALTLGRSYTVYAADVTRRGVGLYIADDAFADLGYPVRYPAIFFEFIDPRLSPSWVSGTSAPASTSASPLLLISFEDWTNDPLFHERLADGSAREQTIFAARKRALDLEHSQEVTGAERER